MEIAVVYTGNQSLLQIPVNKIRPNPYQPRKVFGAAQLTELASSIRQFGVFQPISVRKKGDVYELVAGERRLRATKMAGLDTIPAIVTEICDKDNAFLALMENLQRENLNYLDEAEGYLNIMQDYGLTQEEVAVRLGKSQSSIANKVGLLKLPESVKEMLRENGLSEGHARALLRLTDKAVQIRVLKKIIADKLTVQMADKYVEAILEKMAKEGTNLTKNGVRKYKLYIRDPRIYINTVKKAVEMISQSGGNATYKINDFDDAVEIVVKIVKGR